MNTDIPESDQPISFDVHCCDIIGDLQGKHIYDVTDHILFYLDWASLKIVGLVSKRWRAAMLVALRTIARKGNPNWSVEQLSSWQRMKSHLENDFQVPVQDPRYAQCLTNSINLFIDHLQDECWSSPSMTLDYLPYLRYSSEDYLIQHLCRMEMSEKFIIAWESSTRLFKCWSRRTLLPINMDPDFQMRNFPSISLDAVEKEFHLFGNHLFYAQTSTCPMTDNFTKVVLTRTDLDLRSRGIDQEEFKATLYVELPTDKATLLMVHLDAVDDMVLLMFSVHFDGRWVGDLVTVQRNLQRQETRKILKCHLLQVPSLEEWHERESFFDKDYFIVQWDLNRVDAVEDEVVDIVGYRTYSLDPPKDDGGTVELRWIASFQLEEPVSVDYREGLIAYTTITGEITVVDVSNGSLLKCFQSQIDFGSEGSMIRLGKGVVICSEDTFSEEDDHDPSVDAKGTTFHVWDIRSIMNDPYEKSTPICTFRTLTSSVMSCEVDDFGIVTVIENDCAKGIQVLSFLPACSHCKRLTKPALLTKCNACKSAAYCSEECRTADWNPHHDAICTKVGPLSFT